jgi:hypothetical protein
MSLESVFAKGMGLSAAAAGLLLLTLTVSGCHGQAHRGGVSFGFSDTPDGFRSSFEMPDRDRRLESIPPEKRSKARTKISEGGVIDESEEKKPAKPQPADDLSYDDEGAPVSPKKGESVKPRK